MDKEAVYLNTPVAVQSMLCSLEGWRIQRRRFGEPFRQLLHEVEQRASWSASQIQAFRDKRLQACFRHCYESVPFYRRRVRELGLSLDDVQTFDDLKQLPILTKNKVKDNYGDLLSETVPRKQQIITHTSGTTGGGLRFATTLRSSQEQWAIWWRYRRWHGLQMGTWCGYFGGRSVVPLSQTIPPFWRYNYPGKQILFSGYHMNRANVDAYVHELRRKKPPWLHGYPSLLAILAGHLLETGTDLGYQVRWVTTGAENLLPQQVELMQQAFGVHPRQHYGMAEAVANFSECEHGRLHVDEDFAAVEFIPNPNGPGYRVIGTSFTNLATPLVRYDVHDLVALSNDGCTCGRPGRIVERIDGRAEDYVVLKNGARLGRMDHIFKDLVNIREAQIYQNEPGRIVLRIVRSGAYHDADEITLLDQTKKRVGLETEIKVQYVERLERSVTGKLRLVVSDIPEGQLKNPRL